MSSASTQWPSSTPVSEPVKDLLHRFSNLTDNKSDDKLGEEIFTEDGTWVFPTRTFKGKVEMNWRRYHMYWIFRSVGPLRLRRDARSLCALTRAPCLEGPKKKTNRPPIPCSLPNTGG